MLYVTYDTNTRRIDRIDEVKMIFNDNNLATIEVDITFDNDICQNAGVYKVDDDENFYIDEELVKERQLDTLRAKREPLLKAFDIYKSNLLVGAISLPEEEHQEVLNWYNLILNLDENAINNSPEAVVRYL